MAAKAYVLVETAVGKSRAVAAELRQLPGVSTVDAVTGPYDIITVVNAPDLNAIGELVTNKIHIITGIVRTVTCLSMSSE